MSKMTWNEARLDLARECGEVQDYDIMFSCTVRKTVKVTDCKSEREARERVMERDMDFEIEDDDIVEDSIDIE